VGIANIRYAQKEALLRNLRHLDADYLIFDLGAGSNFHAIDFFLYADVGIVALLPEPTSIENAYRFIRHAYYRRLRYSKNLTQVHSLIEAAMDIKNELGIKSPADLFREVNARSPEAATRLKSEIEKFRPKILINQSRTENDTHVGNSVKTVCKRYFGIEMDYLGHLDHDNAVWQAVRKKRPLLLEFPNSKLSSHFDRITQIMIKRFGHYRNNDVS
jgi:flagellar biosynthesis protein FlhG